MIDDATLSMLKKKAQWFDIIEVSGFSEPVSFKNSRIHSIQHKKNLGYGVRVNVGGKTGFSHTNDIAGLSRAAHRALELAPFGDPENFDLPQNGEAPWSPFNPAIDGYSLSGELVKGESVIDSLKGEFPGAVVDIGISSSVSAARLVNSRGFDQSYQSSHYSAGVSLTYIFPDGSKVDIWEGLSSQKPEGLEEPAARVREKLLNAMKTVSCGRGTVPVIFTPRAFSRLIGILLTGLNGRSIHKKISPFAEKLGERLFNPSLTITDDPTLRNSPFSYPFDDEGTAAQRKNLVEDGSVASFITDLKYASLLGLPPTGNGTRGYSTLPSPSFTNVLVKEGSAPSGSMIEGMKSGILVDQFIGLGQSNTLTGDFSGILDLAYRIDGGAIAGRVKDCMITDNLFTMLAGDFTLSSDRHQAGSFYAPYALFPSLNFSC